jgi:hypothetical protein
MREALYGYLKLLSSLHEIYGTTWRPHPNCTGVIHENGIGCACEPPISSDLSPAGTF